MSKLKSIIPEDLKRIFRILLFQFLMIQHGVRISDIKFIGVTGTSGKTTTSSMIYHLLNSAGLRVGLISTVGVMVGKEKLETGFHVTTPDPKDLIQAIKLAKSKGVEYIVLESSSHALAQGRLGLIKFSYAVYTNIKEDHLDWHKTWKNYALSKARMINMLINNGRVILNKGDTRSYKFLVAFINHLKSRVIKTIPYEREVEVRKVVASDDGLSFEYKNNEFKLGMLGVYNLDNILASIKIAEDLNVNIKTIQTAASSFKGVEGRMQILQKSPFTIILDFAHNTDSLDKSLTAARSIVKANRKVISVFGSAGLRDINKRYDMGRISGKLADITIITAEDPRTEKLSEINSMIIKGCEKEGAVLVHRFISKQEFKEYIGDFTIAVGGKSIFIFDYESVENRFDAIELAIRLAKEGDVVITNGKGHEKTLCFGTTEYPFSDREAIERVLKR